MLNWISSVPQTHFYNFDSIGNTTQHFLDIILPGESGDFRQIRMYETPSSTALALYAYFNSCFDSKVAPEELDKILCDSGVYDLKQPVRYFNTYLPDEDEIVSYVKSSEDHIQQINSILVQMGEPELDTAQIKMKDYSVKQTDIDRALLKLIVHLYKKMDPIK